MLLVQRQANVLSKLLATPRVHLPPTVFLYGHPGTGKRTALRHALLAFSGVTIHLDCVECYTPSLLYQLLWQRLRQRLNSLSPRPPAVVPADNVTSADSLVHCLTQCAQLLANGLVVVLERADRLRTVASSGGGGEHSGVLATLLRLQQLSGLNVCTVLVTSVVWDKFTGSGSAAGLSPPLQLHFDQFSRQQLCQLLEQQAPVDAAPAVYAGYVRALVFTLYVSCRSVSELQHMAASHWHHYTRPLRLAPLPDTPAVCATNVTALWKHVEPHLRAASRNMFLRNVASSETAADAEDVPTSTSTSGGQPPQLSDLERLNAELPFYSKFLLIAAFLASYNPAKTDRRFFVRSRDRQRRRQRRHQQAGKTGAQAVKCGRDLALIAGPRAFPLHRLFAIFYFIVEDRVTPTAHLYTQLVSLVALRLLARATSGDNIDTCKLRCLTSLHTTRAIARSVDFQLDRYLYDFV